jgi:hypothetical protein
MKCPCRWLFNLLAGMSLLLCVAALALWVRTHSHADHVAYFRPLPESQDTLVFTNPDGSTFAIPYQFKLAAGYHLLATRNELGFFVRPQDFLPTTGSRWAHESLPPRGIPFKNLQGALGFYVYGWHALEAPSDAPLTPTTLGDYFADGKYRYVFVPLWFLAGVFAILPIMAFRRWRRREPPPGNGTTE